MFMDYVWDKVDLCFISPPISKTINNVQKVLTYLLELYLISSNFKKRLFPLVNKPVFGFGVTLAINKRPFFTYRRKTESFKQQKNFYHTIIKFIQPFNIELLSFNNKTYSYTIESRHIREFLI